MKTLIAIGIIQLAAIFWLYTRIADLDDRLDNAPPTPQQPAYSHEAGRATPSGNSIDVGAVINEDRLRQIIREELVVQFEHQSSSRPQASRSAAPPPVDPVKMEARREQVSEQLEYYVNVGSISDAEMQMLQIDIAKLDAEGRTEMLRELTRAINSGRLEGQL
ncbi:MAG: hypothetical protein EX272_12015 [Chromatiales bacterium]|nr:MAG: hypothetical protein EX272_12015 [Chromatiales bacterium]